MTAVRLRDCRCDHSGQRCPDCLSGQVVASALAHVNVAVCCAITYAAVMRSEELKQTFAISCSAVASRRVACTAQFPVSDSVCRADVASAGNANRQYTRTVSRVRRCYETCRVSPVRHTTGVLCRSTGYSMTLNIRRDCRDQASITFR